VTHKMTVADDVRHEFAGYDLALMQAVTIEGDFGARAIAYENSLDERGLLRPPPGECEADQ